MVSMPDNDIYLETYSDEQQYQKHDIHLTKIQSMTSLLPPPPPVGMG